MIIAPVPQRWTALQRLPLQGRILALPDEARDVVRRVNDASGLAAVPAPVTPTLDWQMDLREALCGMPPQVLERVAPLLLGICLGRGLGSSGITDIVVDAQGQLLGCLVLLDVELLAPHGANSWATWKENLPFVRADGHTLEAAIAWPEQDTRAGALQYLLLHEFAHVLSAGGNFLPRWWEPVPSSRFGFLDLSWNVVDGRFATRPGSDFALRKTVDFYGNAKLGSDAIIDACLGLLDSDFSSLYGATNPYDDFAECFASYVHMELLGRPHVLRIHRDGEPLAEVDNFWDGQRSGPKRDFMRTLLGEPEAVTVLRNAAGHGGYAALPR